MTTSFLNATYIRCYKVSTMPVTTFRNISCTGKYINPSLMEGYDKNRKVENILFENIMLNGKRIASLEELNIDKKDFVGKIQIK